MININYSHQRELILNTLVENPVHPTADAVYSAVKERCPKISLGTVYRNLNQLAENHLVLKIPIPNGCDRFDGRAEPHYHMICERCGRVLDVELPVLARLPAEILDSTGFKVLRHELIIHGLCADCLRMSVRS